MRKCNDLKVNIFKVLNTTLNDGLNAVIGSILLYLQ